MSFEGLVPMRLGDIATFKYGKTIRKSEINDDSEYPVFSGYQVVGYLPTYMYGSPQLLIVCRGAGGTGDVKISPPQCSITNLAIVITVDPRKVDMGYLYWRLLFSDTHSLRTGSAQPQITINTLESFEISIDPNINRQRVIAKSLFQLQSKIQVNSDINQTLEQMAQAIFKSWFVDFEPVKAKIAARERWHAMQPGNESASPVCYAAETESFAPDVDLNTWMTQAAMRAISSKAADQLARLQTEQPEQYAELRATAELFPSAMQDSELGEIPEGWDTAISGDVIDVRDGTHDSPKKSDHGYPLVTSKHITSGTLKLDDAYLISKPDFEKVNQRSKVDHGDVLLTMIGTVGIPYFVSDRNVNFAIKNVGLFKTSKTNELSGFFYLLLRSDGMKVYLESRTAGTTQKYLSLKALRQIDFVLPTSQILASFSRLTAPFFSAIRENSEQTKTLFAIRNNLLPKLLSGELSISDAGAQLAAVKEPADV